MPLTRYGSNPVFDESNVYDYSKPIVSVLKFGAGDYRMWYVAGEDDPEVRRRPAYATSADGITWVKPNLGLVSFGGNSNNNLLLDNINRFTSLTYDAANNRYLMMLAYAQAAADYGIHIYSSNDGINFSSLKTVITATAFGTNCEGRDLVQRADGRWLAYYSTGHAADLRNVGAFLSVTSDITGSWTHIGPVLGNAGSTAQRYGIAVQVFGAWYLGYSLRYNSTAEQLVIDLFRSRDALNWSLVESNWLPLGASGQFDDEVVYLGKALVQEGSEWRYYYSGWEDNHGAPNPKPSAIGFATADNATVQGYLGTSMPLSDNLTAYYSLGSVTADAGGLNLTNNATVTFVSGKVGNAANFVAASSQYLSHADNALFDMGDIDFTITAWVQLASKPGANMAVLSKFLATGNQRSYSLLWQQSTDRLIFQISPDGTTNVTVTASNFGAPATATWYFVAVRHNAAANIVSISVNDGVPNTAAVTGGAFASTTAFEIGRSNATSYWNGLVDEVGIWKRLLSDAEITDLYNSGNGRNYAYVSNFNAAAAITLADVTIVAAAAIPVVGAGAIALDGMTAQATGIVTVAALAAITLDPVTLASIGTVVILGAATITLANVTLVATNEEIAVALGVVYGPRATAFVYAPRSLATVEGQ